MRKVRKFELKKAGRVVEIYESNVRGEGYVNVHFKRELDNWSVVVSNGKVSVFDHVGNHVFIKRNGDKLESRIIPADAACWETDASQL